MEVTEECGEEVARREVRQRKSRWKRYYKAPKESTSCEMVHVCFGELER